MERYFMTIPEACQLVLEAAAMGKGGEIFVLDMGKPVKVVDLARDLIALSGLREGEDIDIQFTGVRPGEKLSEQLSLAEEGVDKTGHPKVFIGRIRPHRWDYIMEHVKDLATAAEDGSPTRVRASLQKLVPEYSVPDIESPPVALSLPPMSLPVEPRAGIAFEVAAVSEKPSS
jgi:FlaA1/EpsC-like NDP-sugar epimerase